MSPVALWITRVQAVALVGVTVAVVVLATTSRTSLPVAFVLSEVVAALLGAVLLASLGRTRRVRTPVLLLEIIAVGVAGQLVSVGRPLVAALVGLPALAAVVTILMVARTDA